MSKSLLDLLNKTRGDIASKRGNNIDLTRLKDGNNYLRIFPNKDEQVVKIIARVAKHLNHDAI
ncbi:TPA: regulator, partial [Escherichia coli]